MDVITERYNLCDKCGEKIEVVSYDAFECTVEHKTGESYPEGGSGDVENLELCKTCAIKMIDLLSSNGYNIQKTEWDW